MNRKDQPADPAETAALELTPAPEGEGETLIELLLGERAAHAEVGSVGAPAPPEEGPETPARIDGVLVGELLAFEGPGALRVSFPGAPDGGVAARAIASVGAEDAGCAVALMFEGGDPARPIVMGRMAGPAALPAGVRMKADGDRLELTAEREITLRCGDSSITLTRAGKILIRGAYVLSRSSGVNRIQGGSVEIN